MITKKQFDEIEEGNIFEAGELIKGLSDEKIVWKCISVTSEPRVLKFDLFYYDVPIGKREMQYKSNRVQVKEVAV